MKTKVTELGITIPRKFLKGIKEVEIRKENNVLLVVPVTDDPILQLGSQPIDDSVSDASENHETYIYSK